MKLRKIVDAFVTIGMGLVLAVIAYALLLYLFAHVESWYFHRFVESIDPDPTWPPLMWVHVLILPPVAATIGGVLAIYIYKHKNIFFRSQ
jgi:hypothetical protein